MDLDAPPVEAGAVFHNAAPFPIDSLYTPAGQVVQPTGMSPSEEMIEEVIRFAQPPLDLLTRLAGCPLVLWRPVLTPNQELFRFLSLAQALGRPPLIWETPQDWFTPALNPCKRALAKLPVYLGRNRRGGIRLRHLKVAPLWQPGRPRLVDVACLDGTPLIDFHHDLCRRLAGAELLAHAVDARPFDRGERPRVYYERAFALFACLGVLAESFGHEGAEREFVEEVVLPAFESTVRRFGVRPTIVRLLPAGDEANPYWDSYPPEILPFARRAARRCAAG